MGNKKIDGSLSLLYLDEGVTFDLLCAKTKNAKMLEQLERAQNLAKLPDPILLLGETGVGKNMIAQAIHNEKKRTGFCEVTCSGISQSLFESELFGHEPGAFSGALKKREGLAKAASGGTLFLDEISEISLELQAKLLRLIEQKRFTPVGSDSSIESDIHIVCATNKTLEELRDPQVFRSDLFYRMPLTIAIPPLRERVEDIPYLISEFFDSFCQEINNPELAMLDETLKILRNYDWPGNVRELKFAIKVAVYSAAKQSEILPKHLPSWIDSDSSGDCMTLKAVEKKHILHVLDMARGNKTKAAKILDIGRNTLLRKMKEDGIKGLDEDEAKV